METGFMQFSAHCIDAGVEGSEILWRVRTALIHEALRRENNNKCRAAKLLKIHRNTLQRWLDTEAK